MIMGNCCGNSLSDKRSNKSIARAYNLSDKKVADYKKIFEQFDKNNDGKITATELGLVMESLGRNYSMEKLTDMVESIDKDRSGAIEFDEFVQILIAHPADEFGSHTEQHVSMTFDNVDKDKDGYIDASELRQIMAELGIKLTDKDINEMIAEADRDKDGKITKSEFKSICGKWLKKRLKK